MIAIQVLEDSFFGAEVKRGLLKFKKTLVTFDSPAQLKKDKVVLVLPSDTTSIQHQDINIIGSIPESLVIHKLFKDQLEDDKKIIVLNIGKEYSRYFLLNQSDPKAIEPNKISTSQLIPYILKKINSKEISLGLYFGVESLSFDRQLFQKQTGIKLQSAEKYLKALLESKKIEAPANSLSRYLSVISAAIDTSKEDLVKLNGSPGGSSRLKTITLSLGVALIIAGIAIGVWRFVIQNDSGSTNSREESIITPSPSPTLAPSPTSLPVLDSKYIKIRVLNGSGIPGVAGVLASDLSDLDFDIVDTGNADSFEFLSTLIRYKEGEKNKADFIMGQYKDLSEASAEASLEKDEDFDIEIVVGQQNPAPSQ